MALFIKKSDFDNKYYVYLVKTIVPFFGSSGFSMDTGLTFHNRKVSMSGNSQSF